MSKCPKCGSIYKFGEALYVQYECESTFIDDELKIQSDRCRIAELESQLQAERASHEVTKCARDVLVQDKATLSKWLRNARDENEKLAQQLAEAHQPLKDLLDSDMPTDLVGAVNYIIDHSNKGWSTAHVLEKRIRTMEAGRPLCPDCRDKCRDMPCLRCTIQGLQKQLREATSKLGAWELDAKIQGWRREDAGAKVAGK